jgi:hypothetical protein
MFTTTETFKEHLIISFNLLFLEAGKDLTRFSDTIAEFLDNLVSIYGVVIVDVFASELNYSLKSLLRCYAEPNEDFFAFCLNIFKKWDNLVFYLLLIKLLPTKEPSEDDLRRVFHELVRWLETSSARVCSSVDEPLCYEHRVDARALLCKIMAV